MADYSIDVDYSEKEDVEKLMASRMAYNILHLLEQRGQMYSKEIAEALHKLDHETSKASVSNYLKRLRDFGFIERGKRTKAQYYKISRQGMYENWVAYLDYITKQYEQDLDSLSDEVREEMEENKKDWSPEHREEVPVDEAIDQVKPLLKNFTNQVKDARTEFLETAENSKKLANFFKIYCHQMLKNNPGRNLDYLYREILFNQLIFASVGEEMDMPEDLQTVIKLLSAYSGGKSSIDAASDAIVEVYQQEEIDKFLEDVKDVERLSTKRLKEVLEMVTSIGRDNRHSKEVDLPVEKYQTFAELEQDILRELEEREETPENFED